MCSRPPPPFTPKSIETNFFKKIIFRIPLICQNSQNVNVQYRSTFTIRHINLQQGEQFTDVEATLNFRKLKVALKPMYRIF